VSKKTIPLSFYERSLLFDIPSANRKQTFCWVQ